MKTQRLPFLMAEQKDEYRAMKRYWRDKLAKVSVPFELRLINGYAKNGPEVLVVIDRVRRNKKTRLYALHVSRVVSYRNWSRTRGQPT